MTRIYEALERLEKKKAGLHPHGSAGSGHGDTGKSIRKYEVLHPVTVAGGSGKQTRDLQGIYSGMLFRIERLLEAGKSNNVVQLVGSRSGEGTSTVARELARTAVRNFDRSVLLVNMDGIGNSQCSHFADAARMDIPREQTDLPVPQQIHTSEETDLHLTRMTNTDVARIYSGKNGNSTALDRLRQNYDLVIIDSPALEHNETNPFFPLAGAVVLVVEAEKTKHQIVRRSKEYIERQGGNLIGIVLNKKRFHVPDWLYERL